jgi:hypothetical protein
MVKEKEDKQWSTKCYAEYYRLTWLSFEARFQISMSTRYSITGYFILIKVYVMYVHIQSLILLMM